MTEPHCRRNVEYLQVQMLAPNKNIIQELDSTMQKVYFLNAIGNGWQQ